MKIFAVYSKIEFIQKPDWLDGFCKKYTTSSGYHVTLKQSCFLEDAQIEDAQQRLAHLFDTTPVPAHEIALHFRDLALDDGAGQQKTIMINAIHEPAIYKLQQDILTALLPYRDYVYKESQAWEERFKPHITIASDISQTQYAQALNELGQDYSCAGVINDVSLIIVDRMTPEEADKPKNQILYRL